ncbi:MAG TPA: YcjF family protein [Pseudolabrys sp.]|nr:YcjF family protein [Pseudolabrys sp.]
MTKRDSSTRPDETLRPQVVVVDTPERPHGGIEPSAPRIIATRQKGRIVPAAPVEIQLAVPSRPRRYSVAVKLALTGLAVALCGWLGVDLYLWIASAFDYSKGLGWAATAAAAAGISAAIAIIVHEARSYLALKNVEINQQRLAIQRENARASDVHETIRDVIKEIPTDRESTTAIEAFQRKVQRHHSPAQQIELLSETVITPLDRRAEAIVRRASARAFGITAISPAAAIDVLFFIACSIRMVREIAACYGHRPTALATVHLLRRLVVEAGKLGAVDFAGVALTQHIGGAVLERVATSAAESMYAAQRMARLGLVTMGMCRPIPFRRDELPGIFSSLIGNLLAQRPETGKEPTSIPDRTD